MKPVNPSKFGPSSTRLITACDHPGWSAALRPARPRGHGRRAGRVVGTGGRGLSAIRRLPETRGASDPRVRRDAPLTQAPATPSRAGVAGAATYALLVIGAAGESSRA